jgi:PAS domain S-box-containing protein
MAPKHKDPRPRRLPPPRRDSLPSGLAGDRAIREGSPRAGVAVRLPSAQEALAAQRDRLHQALDELGRRSHLYSALSEVNQAILQASSPTVLERRICEVMVRAGKFQLAWIGWEEPGCQEIRVTSRCAARRGALEGLLAGADHAPMGTGVTRSAIREGRTFVANDLRTDLPASPWREAALQDGVAAAAAIPLRRRGRRRGALMVCAGQRDFFGAPELELLGEAAETAAFAMDSLELDAEHKQAVQALAASEAKARSMLATALDGVWLTDAEGAILDANEAACRMLGYSHEELCCLAIGGIEDGEAEPAVKDRIRRLARCGTDLFETSHRRKNGTLFPVEVSVTLLPGGDRLVVYIRDISERKRWEAALQEREERYRTFFDFGPDGIVVLDPDTARPIEFNDQACRQLGYTREEFQRLTLADIEAVESAEAIAARIRGVRTKGLEDFETRQRTKHGELRDIHVTAQLIRTGGRTTCHCVWRDITERKAALTRMTELNARLASLTLELTQAEQRERQRLAQVLHDHLQQQLVGATFGIESLRPRLRSRTGLEALEQLSATLRSAIAISRDLALELCPPVFREPGLAGGLEWIARQAARNFGLQVALDLDGNPEPESEGTRLFVFEAVRELLLNVAKHAGVAQAQVRLGPAGDREVAITVSDAGVGFDPARLEAGGAGDQGLGLFGLRERLRFLKGSLEITSAPGHGTAIRLGVPVRGGPGEAQP